MSADWPIVRLGDYCLKVGSGATPRGGASVYLDEGEICLIRSQNIYNDGFKSNGLVYITEDSAEKLKNVVIEKNDVLLNITGDSVARVCLAKEEYLPARVNQHVSIIRPDPKEFDARYLRYLLTSPAMQKFLLTIAAVGATRNALTKNMIETLEVSKPPLVIQEAIAAHLETLDDKIELNRQANQTLENIAQAIFKSWFVDFDPTRAKIVAIQNGQDPEHAAMAAISGKTIEALNQLSSEQQKSLKSTAALFPDTLVDSELGKIPDGWDVKPLSYYLDVNHGYAFKGEYFSDKPTDNILLTPGNFKVGGGFKFDKLKYYDGPIPERYILDRNDLLVTMTDLSKQADTLGFPALVSEVGNFTFLHNQRLGKVVSKSEDLKKYFLYFLFKSHRYRGEIVGGATGTTVKHTAPKKILAFTHPFQGELEDVFDNFSCSIYSNIESNMNNNETLIQLRDTLLPKLLSGELDIDSEEPT
ncbi:MAG: restriction endonuclease subunit S [Candidatus Thiodiazotropha sp. (ex Troendleina suluensis)]|nr:restriction endonuclease subunit S [Candidatus Thiodiazotropha sp. (ex Troendleina suluensis)]